MRKVVQKADGVFLWARLALNNLIKGVLAKDSLDVLTQRLENLQNTLDGIFGQLLQGLDEVHRRSAANYLQFENHWYSGAPGTTELDLTVLDVAFACEPDLSKHIRDLVLSEQEGLATQDAVDRCKQRLHDFATSLHARCAGLLDVRADPKSGTWNRNVERDYAEPDLPVIEFGERPLAEHCFNLQVRAVSKTAPRPVLY